MASSSSSSASPWWKYDVFLSFRGQDTRKIFVSHLYDALDRKGIYTYKDDITLPKGENIAPALLTAIEESRFAVVVLSKNYSDSSWCLDELVKIMQCKKEKGLIVLPVFYDVDPSDVRKQRGVFGEAFSLKESDSRIGVWREALVEAANVSGWEPKYIANGDESKCIKEIVERISLGLCPTMSTVNEDLIGIEPRMQDVKSLLEVGSNGVHMIGILGIGGGGKTTVASAVYNEISREFDSCSFVANVRENSKLGLEKLQKKVLRDVLKKKDMTVGGVQLGKSMIKNRLCCIRVLMILDDVDHISQLEALAGSHNWFGEGSRIIITTRDEHLLKAHHVNAIYNVNLLTDEEAIQLFSRHAFRMGTPIKEFEDFLPSVISYAAGLPLALKVLGSFLCDKDKNEWERALARLKDVPDSEILEKLKISFDGLEVDEQEMFLDIACFYRGREKDYVMEILDACGFHSNRGVGMLIRKSLITITHGKFDMHDRIQEMGHYIVQGNHPNNPEKHSRVWQKEKVLQICSEDAAMGNYAIEALQYDGEWEFPIHFPKALANMKNLRLLDFKTNVAVELGLFKGSYQSPSGVAKVKALPNGLRWISWNLYPAGSLPKSFRGQKLSCLILHNSLQKYLWKGYKNLPNLKMLDLHGSDKLSSTPDFTGVRNLERLILTYCINLVAIHPSIGYLQKLDYLDLSCCFKLEVFPPIIQMKSLKTLKFDRCHKFAKFPEIQGNMDSLTHLSLVSCYLQVVPSSLGQYMTNLVSLNMSRCSNLRSFECSFRFLKRLRSLDLAHCIRLEKLPEDLGHAECLEELLLSNLHPVQLSSSAQLITNRIKNLMRGGGLKSQDSLGLGSCLFSGLISLRKLNLSSSRLEDGDIPHDIGEFSNLIELDLSRNEFSRLPTSISRLTQLKLLKLSLCKKLQELPMLPSSIAILKADHCHSLGSIAYLPIKCDWLCNFSLARCPKLRENKQSAIVAEKVLQSMLQGNTIANHGFSIMLPGVEIPEGFVSSLDKGDVSILQLPPNWFDNYNGFAVCAVFQSLGLYGWLDFFHIYIKKRTSPNHQPKFDMASDCIGYDDPHIWLGYIPFSSFKATKWLNFVSNMLAFHAFSPDVVAFGVKLVEKKTIREPTKETLCTTDLSEFGNVELIELSVHGDGDLVNISFHGLA